MFYSFRHNSWFCFSRSFLFNLMYRSWVFFVNIRNIKYINISFWTKSLIFSFLRIYNVLLECFCSIFISLILIFISFLIIHYYVYYSSQNIFPLLPPDPPLFHFLKQILNEEDQKIHLLSNLEHFSCFRSSLCSFLVTLFTSLKVRLWYYFHWYPLGQGTCGPN